ncbi:MAG: hypothetical protein WEA31_05265 [Pirellulales bacterium]
MAKITETVATFNSAVRTLLAVVVTAAIGIAGWFGYTTYHASEIELRKTEQQLNVLSDELADRNARLKRSQATIDQQSTRINQLGQEIVEKNKEISRLDTALRLIKVDRRLAQVRVVKQQEVEPGELATTIEFVEVNEDDQPIDEPRRFTVRGDIVYVEYLVVKFEDRLVELGESVSICTFRRIFGEYMEPQQGFAIDRADTRPGAYNTGGTITEFERDIWQDFWEISNDPKQAERRGIRAAHGEAVSFKTLPGKVYRLTLRASGGLTVSPAEDDPTPPVDPV